MGGLLNNKFNKKWVKMESKYLTCLENDFRGDDEVMGRIKDIRRQIEDLFYSKSQFYQEKFQKETDGKRYFDVRSLNNFHKHHKFEKNVGKDVKTLYRELSLKFHPDRTVDGLTKEQQTSLFQEINEAYRQNDKDKLMALMEGKITKKEETENWKLYCLYNEECEFDKSYIEKSKIIQFEDECSSKIKELNVLSDEIVEIYSILIQYQTETNYIYRSILSGKFKIYPSDDHRVPDDIKAKIKEHNNKITTCISLWSYIRNSSKLHLNQELSKTYWLNETINLSASHTD